METWDAMVAGFQVALSLENLLYCMFGVTLGTAIGVLPGLGPVATMAILLPLTYNIPAEASIIMLAGIYYGAMYGGSTTSILVNLPGEAASVITCIDGYQMAKQGRAGIALGIAAIGSFIAATVAIVGLSIFAPIVSAYALLIGPPEYTTLMLLGLTFVVYLSSKSYTKAIISAMFGLLLACIGADPRLGIPRLTFGSINLMNGLDFAAIAMGLFGVGEILYSFENKEPRSLVTDKITQIWPSIDNLIEVKWPIIRGSIIGFFVGALPGGGAVISSLLSYAVEKRVSKNPEEFGKGAMAGVAGPESANNSAAVSAFIPLLTLGLPANAVMAMLFGALMIHGVTPGPFLIQEHPTVFWGVIASMYIGNILLLILNLPLVGIFVQLLKIRMSFLSPAVVLITMIGVYSINSSIFEMGVVLFFGIVGYLMRKFSFEPGPMILAFVLGPILETSFRQSLLLSYGDMSIFIQRPIALTFLLIAVALVALQLRTQKKLPTIED
ncbi:MAG: tripartite tricarboxylate transporter permease [Negativicutes bacterium]